MHISLGGLAYLVIGLVVASVHNYLNHLVNVSRVVSALLGIILWPLVLGGVNVHIHHLLKIHF